MSVVIFILGGSAHAWVRIKAVSNPARPKKYLMDFVLIGFSFIFHVSSKCSADFMLKIDHGLLAYAEDILVWSFQIGNQRHDDCKC